MEKLRAGLFLIAGVILFLPVTGVLGAARLAALYGLQFDEPNLLILMRHRAVLFGLLGGFTCAAAFRPAWQPLACGAGVLNVVTFLWLAWSVGNYNAGLRRIVVADLIILTCLVAAWLLGRWQAR